MSDFTLQPSAPQPQWYDSEIVTADPWPLPAVKEWEPKQHEGVWDLFVAWLDDVLGLAP
jgi:hypothetical protein